MRFRLLFSVALLLCLAAPLAFAQTTGSVSGTVRDPEGNAVPGVTVTVVGPQLPSALSSAALPLRVNERTWISPALYANSTG